MTAPTLLLLSGAGLPAWTWDPVRAEVHDGIRSVVFTPPRGSASLSDYASAALEQGGPGPLVLVAHSSGGAVAAQLMSRPGAQIAGVLAVCAVVPRPGRSFAATLPLPARVVPLVVLRLAGTRPPDAVIRKQLGAGLPDEVVRRLVEDHAAESRALFTNRTGTPALPSVRRYLLTTNDREVSAGVQRRSAQTLDAQHVTEVATGHLPQLQAPGAVVHELQQLLGDLEG